MKTLIELKQAAESKGLRFEVNKWDPTIRRWETDKVPNPDFMKIEIGIEYRPNIWAWFDGFCEKDTKDDDLTLFFRETYNQVCGRQNKTWKRGRKKIVKCKFTRAEYIEFSQMWEWHRKNYLAERKRMRELFQIAYYDKFKMYASETCDEYEAKRSKKKDNDLTMEDILAINMMAAACKNKSFYKQIGEVNDDEDDE